MLRQAEDSGFEVFVTTDQNLRYQQNLADRSLAIVVLTTTSWPRIEKALPAVLEAVASVSSSGYIEVPIP